MAIFGEIGKKISKTTQSAVKGTKDLADIARINSQISDEQRKQSNFYTQIGMKYYELFADTVEDENFVQFCASITECTEKIESLKVEIQRIKGIKKCGGCGGDAPLNSVFCGVCGHDTRLDDPSEAEQPEEAALSGPACPQCNQVLEVGMVFCTGCGHKMQQE